ncbi:NAD-dependent epimerase/dehydratase family protein [Ectobacillus polymachus]|uniref:NAD-dependent epimerase/dehydratase family protein n=1 Tax=Ectobacillus polymachus TaxID=1508806 RepID=UPI003A8B9C2B
MKHILITGSNSYIGNSVEKWLDQYPDTYSVDKISLRTDEWKEKDFSKYDVVLHVAGIAHIKETEENSEFYYKVNRDLVYEVAQKAKSEEVKQFIFVSSMSVYGIETGIINKDTIPSPKSNYGKSKLKAEELIAPLEDVTFKIAVLRPPMIYGKGCKGNYQRLAKLALKVPFFPYIENKRSMIYIDNLCEFVKLLIDDCSQGLFFPQNEEYVCTSEMVKLIAEAHRKTILMTKLVNPLIKLLRISTINKVFGDLMYEKKMSEYSNSYADLDFNITIRLTEKRL